MPIYIVDEKEMVNQNLYISSIELNNKFIFIRSDALDYISTL